MSSQQTENSEARLDIVLRIIRGDAWVREQVEVYLAKVTCRGCGRTGVPFEGYEDIYLCSNSECPISTFTSKQVMSFKKRSAKSNIPDTSTNKR